AYLECLSSGVPVLAWDQGLCLDPDRFAWGQPDIPASSVPYFDARCGLTFQHMGEFPVRLVEFMERERSGAFSPREFVVEHLNVEKCAKHFVEILHDGRAAGVPELESITQRLHPHP